jgi:hypothetical protein
LIKVGVILSKTASRIEHKNEKKIETVAKIINNVINKGLECKSKENKKTSRISS